eukprot:PhM_4_TR10507/c2_g1_i3/m.106143
MSLNVQLINTTAASVAEDVKKTRAKHITNSPETIREMTVLAMKFGYEAARRLFKEKHALPEDKVPSASTFRKYVDEYNKAKKSTPSAVVLRAEASRPPRVADGA